MNEIYPDYTDKLSYFYFKPLFQNDIFKSYYMKRCNEVFMENGKKFGIYKYWPKNKQYGIINEYGIWCWRNTVNTHPYCLLDMYYLYRHFNNETLDFDKKDTLLENIDKLFNFIDKNFELFFTTNIEQKYFLNFWRRCNKSWGGGQITTIAVMYKIRELFPDCKIIGMDFSIMRGDGNDFRGKDIIIKNDCEEIISIQVKGGRVIGQDENGFIVESSVNDLNAKSNYYCFVDITKTNTGIITFQNLKSYIIKGEKNHTFRKEILHPIQINESMESPQILQEIAEFCFSKKLLFELQYIKENTNQMEIKDNVIIITIADFKDPDLVKILSESFTELKKTFK
jgi:hypothetical protein